MLDARLYGHWDSLTEGLRTGEPQNEAKAGGSLFDAIYSDPEKLRGFLKAMTGTSAGVARDRLELPVGAVSNRDADRDTWRLRLHRRRLPGLDARRRLPRELRPAPHTRECL